MTKIAQQMACIHQIISTLDKEEQFPELFDRLDHWYSLIVERVNKLDFSQLEAANCKDLIGLSLEELAQELNIVQTILNQIESPVVFCHNDVQYGNVLRLYQKQGSPILFVDFEYAAPNYRGFDIGNHFCEWAGNYHSAEPHKMDFKLYPTKMQQYQFIEAYLEQLGQDSSAENVYQVMKEADYYSLGSHIFWGLWGILNYLNANDISFDYLAYGLGRLEAYFNKKQELIK